MSEQKIEQLFRDALNNLEADVNPNVWTNIEQGLQAPIPANPAPGSSYALKSAGILGKVGVKMILISAFTVSVIGTVIYFVTKESEPTIENAVSVPEGIKEYTPVADSRQEVSVVNNERISETNNVVSEKPIAPGTGHKQIVSGLKPGTETPGNTKENETGSTSSAVASAGSSTILPQPKQDHPVVPAKTLPANPPATIEHNAESDPAVDRSPEIVKAETDPVFDAIEKYLVTDNREKQGLPNVFTPDGDGLNDVFTIKTNGLKMLDVIIFDISGKKIHSWKSLDGKWNGNLPDGTEASAGNYFYSLNAETLDGKICIAQSYLKLSR